MITNALQECLTRHYFFISGLRLTGSLVQGLLNGFEVGQRQLRIDHLNIRQWVDLTGDMDHVVILKTAHDLGDGVGLADICQEFISQPFTLGGTGNQAGNIDELHCGGKNVLRLDDFGNHIEP